MIYKSKLIGLQKFKIWKKLNGRFINYKCFFFTREGNSSGREGWWKELFCVCSLVSTFSSFWPAHFGLALFLPAPLWSHHCGLRHYGVYPYWPFLLSFLSPRRLTLCFSNISLTIFTWPDFLPFVVDLIRIRTIHSSRFYNLFIFR